MDNDMITYEDFIRLTGWLDELDQEELYDDFDDPVDEVEGFVDS